MARTRKYSIRVVEGSTRLVTVEATNAQDAKAIAKDYQNRQDNREQSGISDVSAPKYYSYSYLEMISDDTEKPLRVM